MHCTTECKHERGLACGNKTGNGTVYISVYKDTQISMYDSSVLIFTSNYLKKNNLRGGIYGKTVGRIRYSFSLFLAIFLIPCYFSQYYSQL